MNDALEACAGFEGVSIPRRCACGCGGRGRRPRTVLKRMSHELFYAVRQTEARGEPLSGCNLTYDRAFTSPQRDTRRWPPHTPPRSIHLPNCTHTHLRSPAVANTLAKQWALTASSKFRFSRDTPEKAPAGPQQELTLVHFSAQLERFVWDRGCAQGLCSPYSGWCRGCVGCFIVSDTAQVELRSGRV